MVKGLKKLERKLTKTIPKAVFDANVKALSDGADEIVALMKSLVPVDSGDLRDSIRWVWGDAPKGALVLGGTKPSITARKTTSSGGSDRLKITILAGGKFKGKDAFYVFFQEFGTENMPPSPFFYVSFYRLKRRVMGRVTRSSKKAILALNRN